MGVFIYQDDCDTNVDFFRDADRYHIGLVANYMDYCPADECIGSQCEACRHRWRWLDGSPAPGDAPGQGFNGWGDDHPRNSSKPYLCSHFYYLEQTDRFYWIDIICNNHLAAYICRKGTLSQIYVLDAVVVLFLLQNDI